jgi:porin
VGNQLTKALFVGLVVSNVAFAEEEKASDRNAETLSGDWGGARSSLSNKGINLEFVHKSDVLSAVSGGIKPGTAWMGNTEFKANMDLEKLLGWDATNAYIHYHSQLGSKFNRDHVGSFMGVDNIENGVNTGQFDSAWIQKSFANGGSSVLAGLYAVDTEFYITEASGLFIQPPYGPANEQAQPTMTSPHAPSVFPVGALAVRVKYTSPENFYLQGALADGVPGDPNNQRGTHIQLNKGDGSLSIVEFGYFPEVGKGHYNKTAVGFWRHSVRADDPVDVDALGNPVRRISQGAYFLAQRTLMRGMEHPSQGLSGFVRFGTASRDVYQADWSGSMGLIYQGLFDEREDDIAGIAVTYNHASGKYRLLNNADSGQTQVEATYRAQLNPWFALLPTLQYFHNPNMDPALKNAWVAGVRIEITF